MAELSGLLRQKQVLKLIPVSAASWWRGVKDGRFPKGLKLGPNTTVWRTEDIQAVIDRLGAGSEKGGVQ